ncbi:hypothetical protein LCGC14_2135750 [marine sediment metagenome]|uniref:Uncharacterized protein n=1 Tax=marine sediment metagenome TaxID=412755 RepID=A0A0F9GD38_9ZZZZ
MNEADVAEKTEQLERLNSAIYEFDEKAQTLSIAARELAGLCHDAGFGADEAMWNKLADTMGVHWRDPLRAIRQRIEGRGTGR